ncbi:MAG: gas vesicle protein [Desulfohalobiaceae bacterium]|nr:gas vesicle protein [Desulfohalobiaceae bacterium]
MQQRLTEEEKHISLCEALDRVLNKGAVIVGEVTISIADIDLVYLGLQAILCSVDTARSTLQDNSLVNREVNDVGKW